MKVGFIGLGTMGFPMAINLLKAGFEVQVFNRSQGAVEKAVANGAVAAGSPKELAEKVDLVLTCLPMPEDVAKVYFAEEGILAGAKPGTILIDHSTVGPEQNRQIYQEAKSLGAHFLDAPISGGPMGAEAATLTIMVGGDKQVFADALPIFQVLGREILHMGDSGSGSIAKLINNLLVGVHTAALSEAFVLGEKAGLDSRQLAEVIKNSTGHSRMIERVLPLIQNRDFVQRFSIDLLYKDMRLATELGEKVLVPLQLTKLAEKMIGEAAELGFGREDIAAIIKPIEMKADIEVN